jgi:type II secretory pathway component HofQ
MGQYVVRSHQLALVDNAMDGQKPHQTHQRGDRVELDDAHPHTATLVLSGAVQSQRAAQQAEQAAASEHQLESEVGRHEARDPQGRTTKG